MPANIGAMFATLLGFFVEVLKALGMADEAAKLEEYAAKIPVTY